MLRLADNDKKVQQYMMQREFDQADLEAARIAGLGFSAELQTILDQLKHIDFRTAAEDGGLAADNKLTKKVTLVVTIRELLRQAEDLGSGLAYDNGSYYLYSAGYWRGLDKQTLQAFLMAAAIKLGLKRNDAEHYEQQEALRKQFEALAVRLAPTQPSAELVPVNFRNGTLDITKQAQTMREARRADFIKYQLPYDYDPAATCPMFMAYLDKCCPDKTAQAVLAEFIGNALIPSLKLQKVLVLYGDGANGKSVFSDIVTELLGRANVTNYTMASLTREESHSRFNLAGKLLNYSSENGLKINAEAFKALTAGDPIEARRLYGDPFIMDNYAKLMFNCNVLPKDIEQTEGYFRRFLIIPFSVKITEAEKDPRLAERITAKELPGILNWVLEGLRRLLQTERYTYCEAATVELENYKKESNSALCFIEDCAIQPSNDDSSKMPLQRLYGMYDTYCKESGNRFKMSRRTFAKTLRSQGFRDTRQGPGTYFYCYYSQDIQDV